jgi:hypothetical protein
MLITTIKSKISLLKFGRIMFNTEIIVFSPCTALPLVFNEIKYIYTYWNAFLATGTNRVVNGESTSSKTLIEQGGVTIWR